MQKFAAAFDQTHTLFDTAWCLLIRLQDMLVLDPHNNRILN
jgi:hypothetical protein